MLSTSQTKMIAKKFLHPIFGSALLLALLYSLLSGVIANVPFAGLILAGVLSYGYQNAYLIARRTKHMKIDTLFSGFNRFVPTMCAGVLIYLYTALWSLLLIIPGIIKAYSYSMTYYIMHDNPGMSASDAIKESQRMMNGHKADLFVLNLSFFPWYLLIMVTCGLAAFYVLPYMQAAHTVFYEDLKGNLGENGHPTEPAALPSPVYPLPPATPQTEESLFPTNPVDAKISETEQNLPSDFPFDPFDIPSDKKDESENNTAV